MFGLGVFVLNFPPPPPPPWGSDEDGAAGLPMGINTFCRLPIVTGDWVVLARASGDEACPVGEENELHGVAERELLSDTVGIDWREEIEIIL